MWLVVAFAALVLLWPARADAQGAGAIQSLPGCTANSLPRELDASTPNAVPLGFTADFFGNPFTDVYVNDNGTVTFGFPDTSFTPFDFTTSGQVLVAAFWADVDTRDPASGAVTYGQTTVDGAPAFCVNWIDVGYHDLHVDKLNSFQLLLVSREAAPGRAGGDFDIVLNYDRIVWESGDDSGGVNGFGGTSAAVGYSNGDQNFDGIADNYFVQPGSMTPGSFLDSNTSTGLIHGSRGTPQPGRYVFEVTNTVTPVFRESVGAGLVNGTVLIREKGSNEFRELTGSESIPLGSSVDATDGRVGITSATKGGGSQRIEYYDGQFNVKQAGSGLVTTKLEGADRKTCKGSKSARGGSKKLARLWGKGRGKARTKGRRGSGTVRGTTWLTEERCNGTFFKVKDGKVQVRDFKRKKNVTLRKGDSYLAKG